MSSVTSLFHGAGSVVINNGTFSIENARSSSDIQALPPGIQRLIHSERISWSSLYNSGTRMGEANEMAVIDAVGGWRRFLEYRTPSGPNFDHTGVDDAINAIFSWVTDPSTESLIMWVHDDDRTKTSFIAQVVAYLLAERQRLSATYFFDGQTDRNSLVPTLVHEFTVKYRHDDILLNEISRVIENNPFGVFTHTPREQLSRLLVGPLRAASGAASERQSQDDIILLHAFEDCNDEGGFQESFLSALSDALSFIKDTVFPQRLLVIGKGTDRLEEFLMGKLASRSPILQRPVQSKIRSNNRDQDIRQKAIELARREEEVRRSLRDIQDKEEKMRQKHRIYEDEFERLEMFYSRKEQEVAERERILQGRENKVRERETAFEQKSKALKKKIQQQELALRNREIEVKTRVDAFGRRPGSSGSEDVRLPSPSSPPSPEHSSLLMNAPNFQNVGMQEVARMIFSASEITKSDRVIILMGPLGPEKHDFIDCLTRCINPWHPSETKTSDQFFDRPDDNLGKGRFWVKAVRTQRQTHSTLLVDFPSLGDDDLAARRILENIGTWLDGIHKNDIAKIAGILYFHPLLEPLSQGPSHRNLRALGQICGDKAARKVIFVFQELPPSPTQRRAEAFFQRHYGDLMKPLGAGFAYFDNTAANGWRIVDRLLGPQTEDVTVLLQEELFVLKRSLHETYAARGLYRDLIARHTQSLRGLDSGSDSTNNQRDKVQAELGKLRRLEVVRSYTGPSANPVNFPDLVGFPNDF